MSKVVAQGCIFGSLTFNICINDLIYYIHSGGLIYDNTDDDTFGGPRSNTDK